MKKKRIAPNLIKSLKEAQVIETAIKVLEKHKETFKKLKKHEDKKKK